MKKTFLLLSTTLISFASNGGELLKNNCASCHMLETPKFTQMGQVTAPPMDAVVFHINLAMNNDKKKKAFIVDYALNPHISKSVCESNKVRKFGVMPSVKGMTSKEDLEQIAEYMLKNYPTKAFTSMIKEMQTSDKMRGLKNSPFLINKEGLPHLTKMLVHNWDKKGLGLTKEQKKKLLVVRKTTITSVKQIKKALMPLEAEVIEAMIDKEDPSSVNRQLEQISKLKLEATKVHLDCISNTTTILSEEQLEFLLPFWN